MYWLYLAAAILFEVAGTTCMKLSQGFTRLLPSLSVFLLYGISFSMMILALKRIELGVAYAIWAGLGTALIAMIGILWFDESASLLRIVSIVLVITGVVGLHLSRTGQGLP